MASFARQGKKIVAIGRNYVEHVKELGNTVPKEPFFFLKPTTSYMPSGGQVEIPTGIDAHHEVELGVVIGKTGRDIPQSKALDHVAGYALAVDMTARNLQEDVKKKGLPWTAVKGFDTFTPIGSFIPKTEVSDPQNLTISLKINDAIKQNGQTSNMIFQIPRLIEHVSSIMTLEEGDLILTGTPHGVGPVYAGDKVSCALGDVETGKEISSLEFSAVARQGGYNYQPFGFANASAIDTLLDRDDVALEAILDEDELLQECKAQNTRLIDYFQRADVLKRLLGYVTGQIEADGVGRFKYPYVATEVLCSEIWSIVETCVNQADELLVPFWDTVLDRPPDEMKTQIAMASHFTKINGMFLSKKPQEIWTFMKSQPRMVERVLAHLETEPFLDLLVRILHDPVVPDIAEWFAEERLIPRLVDFLSPEHRPDMHAVVTELISRIISMAAPSPGAGVVDGLGAQIGPTSNRFARELATRESVEKLIGYILHDFAPANAAAADAKGASEGDGGTRLLPDSDAVRPNLQSATSSVVHAIAVVVELIRKNNSDYFEPYLFHTLRNRLIQVQQQQQQQAHAEDGRAALEAAMREMVDKMGVVHLGPVLDVVCERLGEFQAYLAKPRSSLGSVSTTVGAIAPLTAERYRICELYAELLHCSNMALLNRPVESNALYDAQGRLQGGLAALEDLARVIAMGAGAEGESDAMDQTEDELEPAQELPVSDPAHVAVDSDEEMSSSEDEDEPGSSDDDAMDEIAIDDDTTASPGTLAAAMSDEPVTLTLPEAAPTTATSPPPALSRGDSDPMSPGEHSRSGSRPRSLHSRRSSRRAVRRSSQFLDVQMPSGEKLKQKFLSASVLPTMLDLFFEFPWNNFLHSVIYDLVHQILTGRVDKGSNRDLILALFKDARLMHRIVEGQQRNDAESAKPKGVRLGYMGHLTLMSEDVISALEHYPPDLRTLIAHYAPVPDWEEYVNGRYNETKKKDTALLGGGKPVIAPGQQRVAARWKVDEAETPAATADAEAGAPAGEERGEFRRASGNRPIRESSADFGPAPVEVDDDDDDGDDDGPPQFARYLAQEMQATHQFESGSSSDASDDDDDEGGGWLARSTFDLNPPPASSRQGDQRPLEPSAFDDTFGATSNAALADSYDDPFSADDDDAFGPFSDSAVASGSDPFTFSPTISDELEDAAAFDSFGGDFGDFHSSAGDGESTPTAESWSLTSGSSSGLTDSAEEFGVGVKTTAAPPASVGRGEASRAQADDAQMDEVPGRTANAR